MIESAVFLSDRHRPRNHEGLEAAALKFLDDFRPDHLVLGGDLVDMAPLGRFAPEEDDPAEVLPELRDEADFIRRCAVARGGRKTILPGNHEARWKKALVGNHARALRGLLGSVGLHGAWLSAGLPRSVRWLDERPGRPGLVLGRGDGRVLFRHGDRQAGRFQAVNLALLALRRAPGICTVFGHHHRAQLDTQVSLGRAFWAVANPCMAQDMGYSHGGDPNWQRGFTVVQWRRGIAYPTIVLARPDGSFTFGQKEYRP